MDPLKARLAQQALRALQPPESGLLPRLELSGRGLGSGHPCPPSGVFLFLLTEGPRQTLGLRHGGVHGLGNCLGQPFSSEFRSLSTGLNMRVKAHFAWTQVTLGSL